MSCSLLHSPACRRAVDQAQSGGDGKVAVPASLGQCIMHTPPDAGQHRPEGRQIIKLVPCPKGGKVGVIPVLFARPCIVSGGQQMPVASRADPDVFISRWHRKGFDPHALGLLFDAGAVRRKIAEPLTRTLARDAGPVIGIPDQIVWQGHVGCCHPVGPPCCAVGVRNCVMGISLAALSRGWNIGSCNTTFSRHGPMSPLAL